MDEVKSPLTWSQAMRLAVQEGRKGAGWVAPNPLVGCVILDAQMRVLATGYHAAYGQDHAETQALKKIADPNLLKGAHFVVTLEPCAHEGRTPSCAKRLAQLPLASVVYGVQDPNPLVAGQGAQILRQAGIAVHEWAQFSGLNEAERADVLGEVEDLAEIFLHGFRTQKPFVALKVATSLDGQMALRSGESKWITGEAAREHAHFLRAQYDAVLVGRNTFVNDNPSLNVRHPLFANRTNKVVLFDSEGRSLKDLVGSNLLKVRSPENVFVVVNAVPVAGLQQLEVWREIARPMGIQLIEVPMLKGEGFDLPFLMTQLAARQIQSVFVEGGAQVFGAFLRANCVQRVHLFMAMCLLGAKHGRGWTEFFGQDQMQGRLQLQRTWSQTFENDLYITGRIS